MTGDLPPPDPDTLVYRGNDQGPTLVLSVSDNPQWAAGIQSARYYVENFELKEDMSDHDKGDEDDGKFGLYANQLSMPEKVVIQIKGEDGNKDRPAGCGGGTIECYIERADASIAEKLHFHVPGGSGLAREPLEKLSGGDGGHGGQVNISFCTDYLETVKHIDIVTDLLSDSDATTSSDLESALIELIKFSKEETEAGLLNVIIPEELKTVEAATQCERGVLKRALRKLRERAFEDPAKEIQVNLAQRADVKGGPYGLGTTNGKRGKDGSISVFHIAESQSVVDSSLCFVHPIQCRMLLDKAKSISFNGTEEANAVCMDILQRLQQRLEFLEFDDDLSDTNLGKAYRSAEYDLHLPSGPEELEPRALTMLREVKEQTAVTQAHMVSRHVLREKDRSVPRGTYDFYKENGDMYLEHLRKVEEANTAYWDQATKQEEQVRCVQKGLEECGSKRVLCKNMIKQAGDMLEPTARKIAIGDQLMKNRKVQIEPVLKEVEQKIKDASGLSADDIISAIGQVIFVASHPGQVVAMTGLQVGSSIYKSLHNLETNDGFSVKKEYILHKLHRVDGSLKSLKEGYTTIKGRIELDDPAGEKLVLAVQGLEQLIGNISEALGDDFTDKVEKTLHAYVEAVEQRNDAVLDYNALLIVAAKYENERRATIEDEKTLRDKGFNLLTQARSPIAAAFVKRIYIEAVGALQRWLEGAERAYNFALVNYEDIIAQYFKTSPGLSLNMYASLAGLHNSLFSQYNDQLEKVGRARQTFHTMKYDLDKSTMLDLKDRSQNPCIDIPIFPKGKENIFAGMTDVRLTKVRLFLIGARTTKQRLRVNLTHSGNEDMLDTYGRKHRFGHQPVPVAFKYNTETLDYRGDETSDGDIGSPKDKFALVGPFTVWKVEINEEENPGLDLSHVEKAYMQFEGLFRPNAPMSVLNG